MNREVTLAKDPLGAIGAGSQITFRGRNAIGDFVSVRMSNSEWQLVRDAHHDRDSALEAIERLAEQADWRPNPSEGGFAVDLILPKT